MWNLDHFLKFQLTRFQLNKLDCIIKDSVYRGIDDESAARACKGCNVLFDKNKLDEHCIKCTYAKQGNVFIGVGNFL